ncbi:MAG: ABC transporter ATP-binding protein/permease [Acidobacteriota bacterium]|nr:ABC transporter ATP-binding protein/permease [Acidobacteriota bacterium]
MIWTAVRPIQRGFVLLQVAVLASSCLAIIEPLVIRWLLDDAIPGRLRWNLVAGAAALVLGFAARSITDKLLSVWSDKYCQFATVLLRTRMLSKLLRQNAAYQESSAVGANVHLLHDEVREVCDGLFALSVEATRAISTGVIMISTMALLNFKLTMLLTPAFAAYAIIRQRNGQVLVPLSERVARLSRRHVAYLSSLVSGVIQIQDLHCEPRIQKMYAQRANDLRAAIVQRRQSEVGYAMSAHLIVAAAIIITLVYGSFAVMRGIITIGTLIALYYFTVRMTEPLSSLSDIDSRCRRWLASLNAVTSSDLTLSQVTSPDLTSPATKGGCELTAVNVSSNETHLEFEHVSFSYSGLVSVFEDLSLRVKRGDRTCLVAPSGTGKTTILRLIMRHYQPTEGIIRYRGTDIATMNIRSYRGMFSIVPQEVILFEGNIEDNLRLAYPYFSKTELEKALYVSNFDSVVSSLSEGLAYNVGPRGSLLSFGQKQRLALARALLQDTEFLLLDEFTSGLDSATEKNILERLESLDASTTVIASSHKPAVLNWAHQVVGLQKKSADESLFSSETGRILSNAK